MATARTPPIGGRNASAFTAFTLRVTGGPVHGNGSRAMRTTTLLLSTLLGAALSLVAADSDEKKKEEPKTVSTPSTPSTTQEVAVIKTDSGDMVVAFWPEVAPKTVENFKKLARQGFYDGTCFHRVIRGFMIQGGDPLTKDASQEAAWGTGGPGYTIKAEFNDRKHVKGVLSMARSGHPDSAGSQFFICDGNPSHLDGQYTAFGKLIKGEEVLTAIANTPTKRPDRPVQRQGIVSIKIVAADSVK